MVKLTSFIRLENLIFIWSTLIVALNCDQYKAIYANHNRPSSVIYGTFKTPSDQSTDLTQLIVECKFVNHPLVLNEVLGNAIAEVQSLIQIIENAEIFDTLAKGCVHIELALPPVKPRYSIFGVPGELLIAPGTKWCGPGNRSTSYDDLGTAVETDKCCRDHDYCPLFIEPGETKFNLTNTSPYTASHCDCDEQLKSCLSNVAKKDLGASLFGIIYFNILQTKCFREVPSEECIEYSKADNVSELSCIKYANVNSTEPVYALQYAGAFS